MTDSLSRCPNCEVPYDPQEKKPFCASCRFPLLLVANKYRLECVLEKGGFGIVYLARHTGLRFDAARVIKVISPDLLEEEETLIRFQREVELTARLSQRNDHVVRIYDDFGDHPELGYYYVMEYLRGHPLRKLLRPKKPLDQRLAFHIFRQLCDTLGAAHQEGIVHRDLNPNNIFMIQKEKDPFFVKILDFGIAKPLGGTTQEDLTQRALGTPHYMSPEQCTNEKIDARSDIYAMGMLLYRLLTGTTAFGQQKRSRSSSMLVILQAHVSEAVESMRQRRPDLEIPEGLDLAVLRSLEKEPKDRYASAEDFWEAVEIFAPPDLSSQELLSLSEANEELHRLKEPISEEEPSYREEGSAQGSGSRVAAGGRQKGTGKTLFLGPEDEVRSEEIEEIFKAKEGEGAREEESRGENKPGSAAKEEGGESVGGEGSEPLLVIGDLVEEGATADSPELAQEAPSAKDAPEEELPQPGEKAGKEERVPEEEIEEAHNPSLEPASLVARGQEVKEGFFVEGVGVEEGDLPEPAPRREAAPGGKAHKGKEPTLEGDEDEGGRDTPRSSRRGLFWLILLLVLGGGGAALYWQKERLLSAYNTTQPPGKRHLTRPPATKHPGEERPLSEPSPIRPKTSPSRPVFLRLRRAPPLLDLTAPQGFFHADVQRTGVYKTKGVYRFRGVRWKFEAGDNINSTPAVMGDSAYFGSHDTYLYAVDTTKGSLRWRFKAGGVLGASPAVAYHTVFIGSWDKHLYAVDAGTGKLRWRFKTWKIIESSPLVFEGKVYFGSDDGFLYAVDARTGKLIWRYETGGLINASPALAEGLIYITSYDRYLYAIDAETGKLRWRFKTSGRNGSSPAVAYHTVYFGSHDRYLYAVDAKTGKLRWRFKTKGPVHSSPAVRKGTVYVGSHDRYLYAVWARTGRFRWRFKTKGPIHSSPASARGMLYVNSHDGYLRAIHLRRRRLKWRLKIGRSWKNASPAVSNGVVYVGTYKPSLLWAIE